MTNPQTTKRENFSINQELPEDLIKEIKDGKGFLYEQIEFVMKKGGGVLNVPEILVGLYKVHGVVRSRLAVYSVLQGMRRRKQIAPTGRKGEYKLVKQ